MLFFAVYYLIIMLGCLLPVLIVERVAGVPGAPDSNAMSGTATHLTKNSGISSLMNAGNFVDHPQSFSNLHLRRNLSLNCLLLAITKFMCERIMRH